MQNYILFFFLWTRENESVKACPEKKDENLSSHMNLFKLYFKHFAALNKYSYIPYKHSRLNSIFTLTRFSPIAVAAAKHSPTMFIYRFNNGWANNYYPLNGVGVETRRKRNCELLLPNQQLFRSCWNVSVVAVEQTVRIRVVAEKARMICSDMCTQRMGQKLFFF